MSLNVANFPFFYNKKYATIIQYAKSLSMNIFICATFPSNF